MPPIDTAHVIPLSVSRTAMDDAPNPPPAPADLFDTAPLPRPDFAGAEVALFAKVSNGVVQGEFLLDGPRIATVLTNIVTACVQQSMHAVYGTAGNMAQASVDSVRVGIQTASANMISTVWSVTTWPLRTATGFIPYPRLCVR